MHSNVAIGFRAKTGRAICVVLGGSSDDPIVIKKFEMRLTDPKVPATLQPYHEVMELPWDESQKAVRKPVKAIEAVARKALKDLITDLNGDGYKVSGVAIVGAAERNLARIGNFHIRAHAAEGLLFRQVLNLAADAHGLKWRVFPDKEFERTVTPKLGSKAARLTRQIKDLRRVVPAPWRTDEKQAATAAWLVLHN